VIGTNNTLGDRLTWPPRPRRSRTSRCRTPGHPDHRHPGRLGQFDPRPDQRHRIARNHFGIFLEGVGPVVHATLHGNQFHRVAKPVKRVIVH
jgi:hypothetical protein